MATSHTFDVLVIGSGASGLAAAVVRRARRRPRRARDQELDPGEQLVEGAGRHPGRVRRGRLARAPRRGRDALVARHGGSAARRGAHGRGAVRRSTGSRSSAARSRARTAATASPAAAAPRASGCSRSATARATRSRRRCARASRRAAARASRPRSARARARPERLAASFGVKDGGRARVDAGAVVLAAGGRCYAEAEQRGELSTNHPNATGEVTRIALDLGAEARDLDALQYHPNGGAWPRDDAGLLDPRDDARVRRRAPQRRRRGVHRLARRLATSSRRRSSTRWRRAAASRPRTAGRRSTSTRRGSRRRTPTISLPYMLRRYRGAGIDPLDGAAPHLPGPPLPERRPRDRRRRPRPRSRGCTPAARSQAAPTGATG